MKLVSVALSGSASQLFAVTYPATGRSPSRIWYPLIWIIACAVAATVLIAIVWILGASLSQCHD